MPGMCAQPTTAAFLLALNNPALQAFHQHLQSLFSRAAPSVTPACSPLMSATRPPARAGKLSDSDLYLHVRRSIADTTDEASCIGKELPKSNLPIVANIKNQVAWLLRSDQVSPSIDSHHHHVIRACACTDVTKQDLLLNLLLQECQARLSTHADGVKVRKEARRVDMSDSSPQCLVLGFIGEKGLENLKMTYMVCVRTQSSAAERKYNTPAVLSDSYLNEVFF